MATYFGLPLDHPRDPTVHSTHWLYILLKNVGPKIFKKKPKHVALRTYQYFMYCWPCISLHLCNKNQLDALFIVSLFRQSTSTCFGHNCSPSSGGVLYIYNSWYVLCFLVDCLLAGHRYIEMHSQQNMKCTIVLACHFLEHIGDYVYCLLFSTENL
jgi:hypothetical protein